MLTLSLSSLKKVSIPKEVECLEYRVDLLPVIDDELLKEINLNKDRPIIFTLRSNKHGGNFDGSLRAQMQILEKLAAIQPDFLDLEIDLPEDFIDKIQNDYPLVKIIFSYHQLFSDIKQLKKVFGQMLLRKADIYKLAMMVEDSVDACDMLLFLKEHPNLPLACIPMGEQGTFARIIAKKFGNQLCFCANDSNFTAAGQISVDDLINIYRVHQLNLNTRLYALLGNPIDKSIGHIFHNDYFHEHGFDACYVKINVKKENFESIIEKLKQLNFEGLSITMPLKELAGTYLHCQESLNTFKLIEGEWKGFSTDGYGAFKALDSKIKNKKQVLILGAGGSAKAIAKEFIEKDFCVTMINREQLMKTWPNFEVIINTLPAQAFIDYPQLVEKLFKIINQESICLDIVYNQSTPFKTLVLEKKGTYISGEKMFYFQAIEQQNIWCLIRSVN